MALFLTYEEEKIIQYFWGNNQIVDLKRWTWFTTWRLLECLKT